MAEITEHRINTVPDYQIHCPEIRREQENRDDDHNRSGPHFLERGRRDLLHLGAHVVVESLDPLWPGSDGRRQRVLFRNTRHGLFPLSFLLLTVYRSGRPEILAGAEGFEPPSSVLETDSLTVELTPLFHHSFKASARLARSFAQNAQDDASGLPLRSRPLNGVTLLLYAACACGKRGRISSTPTAPSWSSGSWWSNSSAL